MKQRSKADYILAWVEKHPGRSGNLALCEWGRYCHDLLRSRTVLEDEIDEDPPPEEPPCNILVRAQDDTRDPGYRVFFYVNGVSTTPQNLSLVVERAIRRALAEAL